MNDDIALNVVKQLRRIADHLEGRDKLEKEAIDPAALVYPPGMCPCAACTLKQWP